MLPLISGNNGETGNVSVAQLMRRHTIHLFMWGYQPHFRALLESRSKDVFAQIGAGLAPKVLLVGTRAPNNENPNPVCIEPEDGEWPLKLFSDLLDAIEDTVSNHDLQEIFYSDEQSMRDKPEVIRRDSVTTAIRKALLPYDDDNGVHSLCGRAYPVGGYYVVPVIQIQKSVFQQFPPLIETVSDDRWASQGYRSFIHACMGTLLSEATDELRGPDPGRSLFGNMRRADEIVRNAATSFMQTPGIAVQKRYTHADLFERFNLISSLMYEGAEGTGHLLLTDPENEAIDYVLRFKVPVPFREPRWARKILQMAANDIALVADPECIHGLGRLRAEHDPTKQDIFVIDFLDHYHWELRCGKQVLLRSRYGEPRLPKEVISRDLFINNIARIFPDSTSDNRNHLWGLFNAAVSQGHGNMIVIASDAEEEAKRLAQQGTGIHPTLMTEELLGRVSGIDGTIILDPQGFCHAIGVILDGLATPDCTPSRGSRYNSGLRYVDVGNARRLAIVVSDDHTVDIIPLLRPQIARTEIDAKISALERATLDNYHQPRNWLEKHRFYLNDNQCRRVNSALDRIEALPREVGEIVINTTRFKADPGMDESYLL